MRGKRVFFGLLPITGIAAAWMTVGLLSPEPAKAGGSHNLRMLGLSKNAKGPLNRVVHQWQCSTADIPCGGPRPIVPMVAIDVTAELPFVSNAPCDEIPLSGTFFPSFTIVARADQGVFGCFNGTWRWLDACGNTATGTMEGTVGCGTHRTPTFSTSCESCRVPKHLEGTIHGQYIHGPLAAKQGTICASIAGRSTGGNWPTATGMKLSIDGVHIFPCITP